MQKPIGYENSPPHHEWDSHTSPIYQSLKLHREMIEEKNKRSGALIFKKKNGLVVYPLVKPIPLGQGRLDVEFSH